MCKIIHTMIRVIDLVRRALICRRTALTERAEVAEADKRGLLTTFGARQRR